MTATGRRTARRSKLAAKEIRDMSRVAPAASGSEAPIATKSQARATDSPRAGPGAGPWPTPGEVGLAPECPD